MTDRPQNLTDEVYERLYEEIVNGEYTPGEPLAELMISKRFNVSRTPVREALRKLELAELVRIIPNKGAVVIGVSEEDIHDVYEIRSLIEGVAASRAARDATPEDILALEEVIDLNQFYIDHSNEEKLRQIDGRFHDKIYAMSGSKILCHVLSDLHGYVSRFRGMSLMKNNRAPHSLEEHRAILEAIRNHDEAAAKRLATVHVENAMRNILE